MKEGKKCQRMKSLTGIILACIFLTSCGSKTQTTERGNVIQKSEAVSADTIEQTAEQTQETMQEAEEFVQTDTCLLYTSPSPRD